MTTSRSPFPFRPTRSTWSPAWRILLYYAAIVAAWLFFADRMRGGLPPDSAGLRRGNVLLNAGFVAATSLLLLWLTRRALRAVGRRDEELRAHELRLERLHRIQQALSVISQAIVRLPDRAELSARICQALVATGGFRLAWFGWHDPATGRLRPAASSGEEAGRLEQSVVSVSADEPEGRGPAGTAFRRGTPVVSNDLLGDPLTRPWHERLRRRGLRSGGAFPIREQGVVVGVLCVYAAEPDAFGEPEVALLTEAAADISFALDNLLREAARQTAAAAARDEKLFSDTMLESMPGILYFYDVAGKFLRWNRNFEAVSGYAAAEIERMTPLDFFAPEDRALLQERIGEVFARGESAVAAPFLAKDGTRTPYFFTGRRVVLQGRTCLIGVGIDVTERQRAELALRESEERFNAFMDASPAIAWVTDEAGRHRYMNRAWERAFGLPREAWIGRTAADLVPADVAERIRQNDLAVLARDEPMELSEPAGTLRGRTFHWDGIKFPFRSATGERFLGGIAIDVTARKQAESALHEVQARLEVVVENLREGLIIAEPHGEFLHWNPAALRQLGFTDLDEGRRQQRNFAAIFDLFTLDGATLPPEQWPLARVRRGEHLDGLEVRVRRRGTAWERIFSYSGSLVAYAEGRTLAFMTLQDVTERKEAERQLREARDGLEVKVHQRTEELQAALTRAEAADRLKSAFLATMSHELRTPLNSIIGFTGIVLQGLAGPLNPEQTKQLGMVRTSARHLLELINDVLDISKIEAGQLEVRGEPFDLRESVARVTGLVGPLAEKKGLALRASLAPGLGAMTGDRRRVEQVLLNLLNNAVKFTARGEVSLTGTLVPAYTPPGRPAAGAAVRLSVRDTGIGIRAADLGTLFQPFRQVDTGLSRQHEGTGLGLAICRRLTDLMGGEITATSEWGQGSEFTVILPLQLPPTP